MNAGCAFLYLSGNDSVGFSELGFSFRLISQCKERWRRKRLQIEPSFQWAYGLFFWIGFSQHSSSASFVVCKLVVRTRVIFNLLVYLFLVYKCHTEILKWEYYFLKKNIVAWFWLYCLLLARSDNANTKWNKRLPESTWNEFNVSTAT